MSDSEKYRIKYSTKTYDYNLYWGIQNNFEQWVSNPLLAIKFTKEQGDKKLTKLLIDHTWSAYLDPVNENSKMNNNYNLEEEREKKKACEVVEKWINSISKQFCSINFNHNMNEVKVDFEELPRSGFVDHGSLYDSLCACQEEMNEWRNNESNNEPKPGTVFSHGITTYVVTSIENTDEGVKYVWVNCSGWTEPDSWGTLTSYRKALKEGKIKILWDPK